MSKWTHNIRKKFQRGNVLICVDAKHLKRELTIGKEYISGGLTDEEDLMIISDYDQPIMVSHERFICKMNLEDLKEHIFNERKKYFLSGIPSDRLIFMLSYRDYNSLIKDLMVHSFDAQSNDIAKVGVNKLSWSPIVNNGDILTTIDN